MGNEANKIEAKVGLFANHFGYSDIEPFEIIEMVGTKTILIREMEAEQLTKPEFVAGGFSAHCTNQHEIKWKITPKPDGAVLKARLHKDGYYHSNIGKHYIANEPRKFYDYNF